MSAEESTTEFLLHSNQFKLKSIMPECRRCHSKFIQMILPLMITLIGTIIVFVGGLTRLYKTDIRLAIGIMLIFFNIITFFVFGLDKCCARNEGSRVAEMVLFYMTFFGSPVGAVLGMLFFRHKTAKREFICVIVLLCFFNLLWLFVYFVATAKTSLSAAYRS